MKKLVYPFTLSVIATLLLASCGLFGSDGTPEPEAQSALPVVQATQSLSDKVTVELTIQYDTAVQYNTVGQIIKFKYIVKMVKNDLADNSTLPNISFFGATPTCPAINTVGNLNDRFDTGEILECTSDYAITQADLDKGSITITTTVNVYTVNSNPASVTVPTVPAKALSLSIAANPISYYQAGQTITYTFTIKNSGSSQLGPAQFTVTNTAAGSTPINCGNADATLASGATLTCTTTYAVTAADLNLASISNNFTASGGGANPSQPATVTVTKTTPPPVASGTTVQHKVLKGEWLWQIARCYGADPAKTVAANSQLSNPAQLSPGMIVNVPNIGSNGTVHAPPQPCVTLHLVQSGDTWSSIAAKYGADANFTQWVNSSNLTVGKEVKVPHYTAGMNFQIPSSTITTPTVSPSPTTALGLTVSATPNTYSQAGQVITFTYVIKNNGSTTLGPAQFTVTDALVSSTPINCGASTTLSPGASTTCTATYTISQPDMSAASISNSATASGGGAPTSQAASTTITKSVTLLTLTVTASPKTYTQAGQVITYNYVIKNSGTTTLGPAQFTVTDPLIGSAAFSCGNANTTLAPNATVTCTANYTITQQDMSAASISNSATASGGGAPASQPASDTITKQ